MPNGTHDVQDTVYKTLSLFDSHKSPESLESSQLTLSAIFARPFWGLSSLEVPHPASIGAKENIKTECEQTKTERQRESRETKRPKVNTRIRTHSKRETESENTQRSARCA